MKLLYKIPHLAFAAWFAGFFAFWLVVSDFSSDADTSCDALVVLTGSEGRVDTGFELFDQGRAPVLFITGVGDDRHSEAFLSSYKPSASLKAKLRKEGAFTIDRKATSTFENAEQTLLWLRDKNYSRLCLVTAHYHMPRSLMVFRSLMPSHEWVPTVVNGWDVKPEETWKRLVTLRVMVYEYHKLIASWLIEKLS